MFERLGEGPHYADPADNVVFGDIFRAPFLRDIFVRGDATPLGGGELPANLANKFGRWMGLDLPQAPLGVYSAAIPAKPEDRFALGHASLQAEGQVPLAILVSDSCLTATNLVQGRQKRSVAGRLLFAPLSTVDEDKWEGLVEAQDFGRFPLPNDDRLAAWSVAELASCFLVDSRSVKAYASSRLFSLSPELSEELEVHWSAYAARRGPRAYERNAFKLAFLLAGGADPEEAEEDLTDALAEVLDLALIIEATDLEAVSWAEEQVRLLGKDARQVTPRLVADLVEHLNELSRLAGTAAEALSAYM